MPPRTIVQDCVTPTTSSVVKKQQPRTGNNPHCCNSPSSNNIGELSFELSTLYTTTYNSCTTTTSTGCIRRMNSHPVVVSSDMVDGSMNMNEPMMHYSCTSQSSSSSSNRINIDRDEMKRYFSAPQVLAARLLGVSVSTLKRRFYEAYKSRWPYQRLSNAERKKSIWYYVNDLDEPEKYISDESMTTLFKAFENPTLRITNQKPIKEKPIQSSSMQHQFLSYIPPSDKTNRYDDVDLTQITGFTQIKGGSKQKYFLIGGNKRNKNETIK